MGISMISLAARYWWAIAIAALIAAVKVQDARLRAARDAQASLQSRIAAMNQQNHEFKSLADECNARVDRMKADGQALQTSLDEAVRRADAIAAEGVQAERATIAHPPANDCESILRYGHEEAARFKW